MGQYYSSPQASFAETAAETNEASPREERDRSDVEVHDSSTPSTKKTASPKRVTPKKVDQSPKTSKSTSKNPPSPRSSKIQSSPRSGTSQRSPPLKSTPVGASPSSHKPVLPKADDVLRVEVPLDLTQCKLAELRELANENKLKTTGTKFELIGRLLRLFPANKLTEDSLSGFKLIDLKSMAKGADLPQVGSKSQIVGSLLSNATTADSGSHGSTTTRAAKTPQPPKRKRDDIAEKAPLTERKTKRPRTGSATKH